MTPVRLRFLLCLLVATPLLPACSGSKKTAVTTSLSTVVAPGTKAELISRQFSFTEGPAVDKQGNVFFTDQPNDKIWQYDVKGKLSLYMEMTGRSNGLYFDKAGNLIACADEQNELWKITPSKEVTVLMNRFQGHQLNGPNDLWIDAKGGIYFTDPYYQRDYWTRKKPDIDVQQVYYQAPGAKEPVMAATGFVRPNGIVGSKDGQTLYIADIGGNKIYRYHINTDATLTDKQLFAPQGADGITLDERGNLYLCGNGVTVYNAKGEKLGVIEIPEKWTANACFVGPKRDILFVTAGTAVYKVPMKVKGVE